MTDPATALKQLLLLKSALEEVARSTFIGRAVNLASWALIVWDWAISIDREVELFWMKPWGFATSLYMFNRYIGGAILTIVVFLYTRVDVTVSSCMLFFKFEAWCGIVVLFAVEVCLAMRVYALWSSSKVILGILVVSLIAVLISMAVILALHFKLSSAITEAAPGFPFHACVPIQVPNFFFALWVPPMAFESLCFFLAVIKGFSSVMHSFNRKTFGNRLIDIIMRDSLMVFVVVVAAEMVVAIIWLRGPSSLLQAMVGIGWAIPGIFCSRLMINLRESYYRKNPTIEGLELPTLGGTTDGSRTLNGTNLSKSKQSKRRDDIGMWTITSPVLTKHETFEEGEGGGTYETQIGR